MASPAVRRLLVALAIAGLLLASCGDDDTGAETTTTTASEASTTAPADGDEAPAETTTSTEPEADLPPGAEGADQVIEVSVSGGSVEGGGRHAVTLGETVALVVRSDADDEIHLHGYDQYADVVAGEPSVLTFEATIPGVFEAELHDAGLPLVELEIS